MPSTRQVLRLQYFFVRALKCSKVSCKYMLHVAMEQDSLHAWEGCILGHDGCFPPPHVQARRWGLAPARSRPGTGHKVGNHL